MDENVTKADRMRTTERTDIKKLYREQGIEPSRFRKNFRCPNLKACSSSQQGRDSRVRFCTGTWPYIGADYGNAQVAGCSIGVLFVAMERGGGGKFHPDSEKFAVTQSKFRDNAEKRYNPHMGGTAQLMEYLVGCKDEKLFSQQFALTNAVKCVEATGNQRSSSTRMMKSRCSEHLREEIECLKPHLVITQGVHPRETVLELFHSTLVKEFPGQAGAAKVMKAEVMLADHFVILTTPHAAHKPGWKWKNGELPESLQKAVNCAIAEVKKSNGDTRTRAATVRRK